MIRDAYDVVVVGGGPAGSMSARHAAAGGASVLLLEKDRDLGLPVRCAEGVGKEALDRYVDPDPRWISSKLGNVRFTAPDGTQVDLLTNTVGYILNRRVFDHELGRQAAQAGAQVITKAYVNGLLTRNGTVQGVKIKLPDRSLEVKAKIVIGADGIESRVGRWAGLRTHWAPKDFETCYQMTLGGIEVDEDFVDCHFGNDVAPGGYAWVFPKGKDIANVGCGVSVSRTNGKNAKQWLEQFVEHHFPKASVLACVAGGVPAGKLPKKLHGNGFMIVGDAAAMANPLTGGGITNALAAGKVAGEVAAGAIRKESWNEKVLAEFSQRWDKGWGNDQRRFYMIKEAVHHLSDDTFNRAAHILCKMPLQDRTLKKVFMTTLAHDPKILIEIARSFV
ncbi:NAD(P)/FAD-dependent oxidoreductase [bacterium]|nr:NAD(P)/FAD-dependent oxidoreductase [bacterium]